nr:hypothetical protein [Bacillus oleivorans]
MKKAILFLFFVVLFLTIFLFTTFKETFHAVL